MKPSPRPSPKIRKLGRPPSPQGQNALEASQPVYLVIADTLARRIAQGTYAPGSRLPSIPQLCTEFGASPMTVRRALAALKRQGSVSCVQGQGTFVRLPDLSKAMFRLSSGTGGWVESSAETRLLSVAMDRADGKTARILGLPEGERVVCLRRLVTDFSGPLMYYCEYVLYDPRRPLLESQLQLTSLDAFLQSDRGVRLPPGELTVRAVNLDKESAKILDQPEGKAALCLEHVFLDTDGRPASWGYVLFRPDLFQLRAQLDTIGK